MTSIIIPTPATRPKRSAYVLDASEAAEVLLSMSNAEFPLRQSPTKRFRTDNQYNRKLPLAPRSLHVPMNQFLNATLSSNLDDVLVPRNAGAVPIFVPAPRRTYPVPHIVRPTPSPAVQIESTVKSYATFAVAYTKDVSSKNSTGSSVSTSPADVVPAAGPHQAQLHKDKVAPPTGAADAVGPAINFSPQGASALSSKASAGPTLSDVLASTTKTAAALPPKKRLAKAKKESSSGGFNSSQSTTTTFQTAAPQAPMHHPFVQQSPFSSMPKTNPFSIEHSISWPPPNTTDLNQTDNVDSSVPNKRVITTSVVRTHSQPGPPRMGWSHQEPTKSHVLLDHTPPGIPITTTSSAVPTAPTAPSPLPLSSHSKMSLKQYKSGPLPSSKPKDTPHLQEHHLPSVVEALSRPSFGPPVPSATPATGFYSTPVVTETYLKPLPSSTPKDTSHLLEHHLPSVVETLSRPSFGPPVPSSTPAARFYSTPVVTETYLKPLPSTPKDTSHLQEHHLPSVVETLSRPSFVPPLPSAAPVTRFYSTPVVTETRLKYTQPGNSSPTSDSSTHLHFSVGTNPITQSWTQPTPCNRTVITEVSPRFGYRR